MIAATATVRAVRIIAGEFRGRRLLTPESDATRPITDRAKQSLFDVISPLIPDARVYDCFAGTGSMGLECLSRGAARVTFFERDRSAVQRLMRNIEALDVEPLAQVVTMDLFKWFANPPGIPAGVEIVFLDPPYRYLTQEASQLAQTAAIIAQAHLSDDGTVVFRHDAADSLELPPLAQYDRREYGSMVIELLRRKR